MRNDAAQGDVDGDGAGTGLERAVRTCDSEAETLTFPLGGGEVRSVRCSELLAPGNLRARARDTDQDGNTDADELFGRPTLDGAIVRWGAHPHRRDVFIEGDYADPDAALGRDRCTDPQGISLWRALIPTGTGTSDLARQIIATDLATAWTRECTGGGRCPIAEWQNVDGTSGVRVHMDLGPHPDAVPIDPLDTLFNDFGGGGCVPCTITGAICVADIDPDTHFDSARRPYALWALAQVGGGGQARLRGFAYGAGVRGTFEHEAGHKWGLSHGGPPALDSLQNYKPNHFSRMNYRYQDVPTPAADLFFSTGDFEPFPLELGRLDECQPLGARDLSHLDRVGVSPPMLVCGTSPDRASCTSDPARTDVDWDGDRRIGGGPATPGVLCAPADILAATSNVLGGGGSAHSTRHAFLGFGHAAAGIPPGRLAPTVVLDGPAMALHQDRLVVTFIDSLQRLNVGDSPSITDENCPFTSSATCGLPDAFDLVVDAEGRPIVAASSALLELRDEGLVLMVYQPLVGNLRWGFLVVGENVFVDEGEIPEGAQERPSLAIDPTTNEVVLLLRGVLDLVFEATLDLTGANPGWQVHTTTVIEPDGQGRAEWTAKGAVGLAAWHHQPGGPPSLYAAYARSLDDRLMFVRRVAPGRWEHVGFSPFDEDDRGHQSVALGVNQTADRLWALWGTVAEGPSGGFEPVGADDRTSTLYTTSALPGRRESVAHRAENAVVHESGPPALLWDDRSRFPGAVDGLRAAFNNAVVCNICQPGFFSDGVPPGGVHADPPTECETFYCRDDLSDPDSAGGFVNAVFEWLPFFDPVTVRVTLLDGNEYPSVTDGICRFVVEGEPLPRTEQCALTPLPLMLTRPYQTEEEFYEPRGR